MPSAPSASKKASCGFTPTTYGATASTSPQQKRVNACAACSRPRCASPRTSTGRRSGRGSSPTRCCCGPPGARHVPGTVAPAQPSERPVERSLISRGPLLGAALGNRGGGREPCLVAGVPAAATADGLLQLAAGGKARNRRRRNVNLLARVARVHALTCRAPLRRELAESGERNLLPALQGLGDRVQKGVDGLGRVAPREVRLRRDLVYEL